MKIAAIYGNPKKNGFVHGCVDFTAEHLRGRGAEVQELRLVERNIGDCHTVSILSDRHTDRDRCEGSIPEIDSGRGEAAR